MMKVASVINNYIHYASEHMQGPFLKLIFPKLYGVTADEAAEAGLVEEENDLDSKEDLIKVINDWARVRGQYKKGSNINPVQADRLEAEQKVAREEAAKKAEEEKKRLEAEQAAKEKADKALEAERAKQAAKVAEKEALKQAEANQQANEENADKVAADAELEKVENELDKQEK